MILALESHIPGVEERATCEVVESRNGKSNPQAIVPRRQVFVLA